MKGSFFKDNSARHGTHARYLAGCRCDLCKHAQSLVNARVIAARLERRLAGGLLTHGTARTYRDGCRCDLCTTAIREHNAARRKASA